MRVAGRPAEAWHGDEEEDRGSRLELRGVQPLVSLAPGAIDAKCVLDAGNNGIIMTADHLLEPREHAWLIPGPEAHWAKLAFEKYFLTTHRMGIA